jgi:imidazolonepropionase-like amidohydrolase
MKRHVSVPEAGQGPAFLCDRPVLLLSALLLLFLPLACADPDQNLPTAGGPRILLTNVHIFDVMTGTMSSRGSILIEGSRIIATGEAVRADAAAERIDCGGGFALPGLFDCHTHLANLSLEGDEEMAAALHKFVAGGITHVRDVGGPVDLLADLKKRIESGALEGPEIFFAGPMLEKAPLSWLSRNLTLPRFTVAVNTRRDVDRIVPELAGKGASLVKTFGKFDDDTYAYLVETAGRHGLRIAHDPGMPLFHDIPMDRAMALGVSSIEHAKSPWPVVLKEDLQREHDALLAGDHTSTEMMTFASKLFRLGVRSISEKRLTKLINGMIAKDVFLCPTLHVFVKMALEEPLTPQEEAIATLRDLSDHFTREMARRKVKLLVGQDGIDPDGALCEMEHLKRCGLGEADIIRGATLYPAQWLGVADRLGAITPGREADIVVLKKNPLDDITNIRTPLVVIRKGAIIARE